MLPAAGASTGDVKTSRSHPEGNVKETVESILVAFILAFVFRAFVVEAFVIPTGSMAPTLLGAHNRFHCADCGYNYLINYSASQLGADLAIPSQIALIEKPIYCPNCGYPVPKDYTPAEDTRTGPAVHYGDRILVLKYRYLVSGPQRWDVVVFKAPDPVQEAPLYTTNFIKRLIGRPGESVMILDGDIFISTAPPPTDVADPTARDNFLKTFKIARKPGYAQDALWRNIYDNDFLPHLPVTQRSGTAWQQPWKPAEGGSGWDVGQSLPDGSKGRTRQFRFDNASANGQIYFDAHANPETYALTDYVAYDQLIDRERRSDQNPVRDLRLSCFYRRETGDGKFSLTLTKRQDRFVAEVSAGKASLLRYREGSRELVKQIGPVDVPDLASGKTARLDFANVDFRASLKVNGNEVLSTGDDYSPDGDTLLAIDREERQNASPPEAVVAISAERQTCTLEHVSLSRDVFYINDRNRRNSTDGSGPLRGSPDHWVTLGPEEYFVLGDNSLISGDARYWGSDVKLPGEGLPFVAAGRVPARFLLGKAFFVYWPAGHRPINQNFWSIIPNFGEMRFIH